MKKNFIDKLWPQILINIGVSIVIPLILYKFKVLDEPQSILFGAMLAIISTTLEVLWYVKIIADREETHQRTFSLKSDFSKRLEIIQQSFGNIVDKRYSEKDLFLEYFNKVISELEIQISKSDSQNELITDRGHVSNISSVLDCFDEDSPDSIRAIHFLKDNDYFFENLSKNDFYEIYRMVPNRVKEVRRLIVFSDDNERRLPKSIKIIRFHTHAAGYSYKAIRSQDYFELLKYELNGGYADFIAYGDKYLFSPQRQQQADLQEIWSKDKDNIQRYIRFFDNIWKSEAAINFTEPNLNKPITIDSLFKLDE